MKMTKKTISSGLIGVLVLVFIISVFMPSPVLVDVGRVERGTLRVSIDEEGRTRVQERYTITSPASGKLNRIAYNAGDLIEAHEIVATLTPIPLGVRERAEAQARVDAASARLREANVRVTQAEVNLRESERAYERAKRLSDARSLSPEALEQAEDRFNISTRALEAARFREQAAASDVRGARAALLSRQTGRGDMENIPIRMPVTGCILRIFEDSERVLPAGTPILEVGDPSDLEVVIDVLSEDAVKIQTGQKVLIDDWGGEVPLEAAVSLIEPSAFTKISALGVEEQRVNIVADLQEPPATLGDGYRVEGRIVIWEGNDVIKTSTSALFRQGDVWQVFVVDEGRAIQRDVTIGHRNAFEVEILHGLSAGDQVVLHPSDQIENGIEIIPRQ